MCHPRILITRGPIILMVLSLLCLLTACSPATKYVLVTDRSDVNFEDGDRFYLCLQADDAKHVNGMLRLRTASEVRKYEQRRTKDADPIEPILFDLIKSNYASAQAGLDSHGDTLPPYLRLLLKADLAYEAGSPKIPTTQLVQMYQDAYENQLCDLNKDLIKIRIRQVRYGR
jgi:hypothetical protein